MFPFESTGAADMSYMSARATNPFIEFKKMYLSRPTEDLGIDSILVSCKVLSIAFLFCPKVCEKKTAKPGKNI